MAFQARVGTWFAAHVVANLPIGPRFGLPVDCRAVRLEFETAVGMDDIVVSLTNGSKIFVQCKTGAGLSDKDNSPLGKTLAQLAAMFRDAKTKGTQVELAKSAWVLATSALTGSARDLEQACRQFEKGGTWSNVKLAVNQRQQKALDVFELQLKRAWAKLAPSRLSDEELTILARQFHIAAFAVDPGEHDWREAARVVGERVFGDAALGEQPTQGLLEITRQLIKNGATADRAGLMRALRVAGHDDRRAPGYDADLAKLAEVSRNEYRRLRRHSVLPVAGTNGLPVHRDCLGPLAEAVQEGSLLVIGEPGAGKTGVLVALVEERMQQVSAPLVFLSVDRLAGMATADDLRLELKLRHPLLEVLASWPGRQPGLLVIDALDASRGESSETVFASLIENAIATVGERWSIVASIRTFDLRHGQRFRQLLKGAPPHPGEYSEEDLDEVRHFKIPRLSEGEIARVARDSADLGALLRNAPPSLQKILPNVFNLSLAAELISIGVSAESIRTVTTQSDLIDRYEDKRLPTGQLKEALAVAVETMVKRRRLSIKRVDVRHAAIDDVLETGVLSQAGDLISFSHHVLFDHAAGRFFLDWNDARGLVAQITEESGIGFMLAPALRFAMERVWRDDDPGRDATWQSLTAVTAADGVDPVLTSVALRFGAERVQDAADVEALCHLISTSKTAATTGSMLGRLARFVGMNIKESKAVTPAVAIAWTGVATAAAQTRKAQYADAARFFLWTLSESADLSHPAVAQAFGKAARELLNFAWGIDPEIPAFTREGIRFVARSFATAPADSRALLEKVLEEPRFSQHAHEEARWLADGVKYILKSDPEFAARIYEVLFGRPAPQSGKTWFGGHQSRILPLVSDARQDYEHARWHLTRTLKSFLTEDPHHGIRAFVNAAIGLARYAREPEVLSLPLGSSVLTIVDDYDSLQDWRNRERGDSADDIFALFVEFLRSCTSEVFRTAVATAREIKTNTSVWSRILGLSIERPGIADDLLWDLVTNPHFLSFRGLSREAIAYLAEAFPSHDATERKAFEMLAVKPDLFREERERKWWASLMARFLSVVAEDSLVTEEMRALRQKLSADGKLTGNRPFVSITSGWGSPEGVVESLLKSSGVDLDRSPDQELRNAAQSLETLLKAEKKDDGDEIERLWAQVQAVVTTIDRVVEPHAESLHSSWGAVSNAVERIAQSKAYNPSSTGHPPIDALIGLIERLMKSRYPEVGEGESSDLLGWGNWDVRVYAASSLIALANHFAAEHPVIEKHIRTMLGDPVATVRLQVAQSLNVLWSVARGPMWEMVESVAQTEAHRGILGFFVGGALTRLANRDPARGELLLGTILNRLEDLPDPSGERKRGLSEESVGRLAAGLWVWRGRKGARDWISRWCSDVEASEQYLWHVVSSLREALFLTYAAQPLEGAGDFQARARDVLASVLSGASAAAEAAKPILGDSTKDEVTRSAAQTKLFAAEKIIDHAGNQLYFGSGAFRSGDQAEPGLASAEAKRRFLLDYGELLDRIGDIAPVPTIHHLIELYGFVASADPAGVFDRLSRLLVGSGAREGYQFEGLASDVLVGLIYRYLADHRAIFEEVGRRQRLVEVLELFSKAGSPDALRLLYELPDLLR